MSATPAQHARLTDCGGFDTLWSRMSGACAISVAFMLEALEKLVRRKEGLQAVFTINRLGPCAHARMNANDSRAVCSTHGTRATRRLSLHNERADSHLPIMSTSTHERGYMTARQILEMDTVNGTAIRAP